MLDDDPLDFEPAESAADTTGAPGVPGGDSRAQSGGDLYLDSDGHSRAQSGGACRPESAEDPTIVGPAGILDESGSCGCACGCRRPATDHACAACRVGDHSGGRDPFGWSDGWPHPHARGRGRLPGLGSS